jgi:2-polyprenyl-3-methyl-5-hydroxy-6-metoxy-1,4-benzoquinol methylase
MLDVGCARGHFLSALSSGREKEVMMGLDMSAPMVSRGRAEFGLDLRCSAVEEADLPESHFGLITMFDVFEHVSDPRATLEKLFRSVRPGGFMVIEVPSETTVFRVAARAAFRMSRGGIRGPIEQLYHRAHVSYFTRRSLARLVESVGGERFVATTKEAHVTRFGTDQYSPIKRAAIRIVCWIDRVLGTEAKLLAAFRRPRDG